MGETQIPYYYDCFYASTRSVTAAADLLLRSYCIRLADDDLKRLITINESQILGTRFTFRQLRQLNITAENLYEWSAAIDTIEQYQLYLIKPSVENKFFYNCSSPFWFGSFCQYTLNSLNSFAETVIERFASRKDHINLDGNANVLKITTGTCYTHLKCNRGPSPLCLDWREICDRKCDCIDDCVDEKDCFQLEINECGEDQFRCRNGMCIPQNLFRDPNNFIDCIDASDETYDTLDFYGLVCLKNPVFDCETLVCSGFNLFVCGNGKCSPSHPMASINMCENQRDLLYLNALLAYNNASQFSTTCWLAMVCRLDLTYLDNVDCTYSYSFKLRCPPIFFFPSLPTLFNNIRFVYEPQKTQKVAPSYVCYDAKWCDKSLKGTFSMNGSACMYLHEFPFFESNWPIDSLYYDDVELFFKQRCPPPELILTNDDNHCHPSLFHCKNTSKCISKYRVRDSYIDCYDLYDELFNESCSLHLSSRFHCLSDDKCIPQTQLGDDHVDCSGQEDELSENIDCTLKKQCTEDKIIFSKICNGFKEMSTVQIENQNETDETNCRFWSCNTHYTRCDKVWNCYNGIDELNCSYVTYPYKCKDNEHHCVQIDNNLHDTSHYPQISYGCLSVTLAGNDQINCLGSADERDYCRLHYPDESNRRYRCLNDTTCIDINRLCDCVGDCPSRDDEAICPWLHDGTVGCSSPDHFECADGSTDERSELCTPMGDCRSKETALICDLSEWNKPKQKYFSVRNYFVHYPTVLSRSNLNPSSLSNVFLNKQIANENSMFLQWHCNYGVLVHSFGKTFHCFCPPAYYGDRCQYQNDFIALILNVRRKSIRDHLFVFRIMIILLDENMTSIYREQILHVSYCEKRYQIYLLYQNRLKLNYQNYSVRIDIFPIHRFDNTIHFRTRFYYTIPFTFLPVNRLVINLNIPGKQAQMRFCDKFSCQNGQCYTYENLNEIYCRCNTGWFGKFCHLHHECNCSPQSICIELSCVCPLGKSGPLCYFPEILTCKNIVCQHGGTCISRDQRLLEKDPQCVCTEEFEGRFCEKRRMRIIISFDNVPIPPSLLVHYFVSRESRNPDRLTSFQRIPLYENIFILFPPMFYNMAFTQFENSYYLIFLNSISTQQDVTTTIIGSNRCPNVEVIFDRQIFQFHPLKRIKHYQLICQQNHLLKCFHDEARLCLCTKDHLTDCFDFNHNGTSLCDENNICQNDGKCYVNDLKCPTKSLCVCQQCYHGALCQFTTSGSVLSLDSIIGYHIQPHVEFRKQYFIIKLSTGITIVMATIGIVSNVFAIMTFSRERVLELGCGFYLLSSSIASLTTMIMFVYKFSTLLITQMALITNESYLNVNCKMTDFQLKSLPTTVDWLNACVATERALTVLLGVNFNKVKSRSWSKFTIAIIILINIISALHDPVNRRLLEDTEEDRIWCITDYSDSSWLKVYNAMVNIFHFIVPFAINLISACIIITVTARTRSVTRKNQTYREHVNEQLQRYKHLFISSSILVTLGIPRLIISYFSGCMKSTRNPWLFLAAYFISFVPPMLTFPIFVIPSKSYMNEFYASIKYPHATS